MSDLKRQMGDIADSLSFMSPFHKEIKLENSQHPGQQYFYQLNNNPDMMLRQNYLQQQQQQQQSQQQFQNQQQQQFQQQQQQQQQQQGYIINQQFYGAQQGQQGFNQQVQNVFGQQNAGIFSQQVLANQYIQTNSTTPSQQQLPQMTLSFMQPIQTQQQQQQQQQQLISQQQQQTQQKQQQQQQQLPLQLQQQFSQQSTSLSSVSQSQQQQQSIPNNNSDTSSTTYFNQWGRGKTGEKAINNFQEFIQMTQHIGQADLNLEFVKDMYTFKMDTLPSSKEMLDHFQRILSKQGYSKQQKKNWNDSETNLLVWIILKSCVLRRVDFRAISDDLWKDISTMMVGRTDEQCKLKWLSMSKLNLQQQPWSEEEDKALIKIIKEYEAKNKSNKWSEIAVKLNQLSHKNVFRQGKQCRERWNNHLDPAINRGPWGQEEEVKMLKLVLEKGKRWSEISKSMQSSRTENSVKNRFNSLLKKEKGIAFNATESKNNQQDLTDLEKIQIYQVIEKMETRIKNGFSLVKTVREGQIEEEENEVESRSQQNTEQHGNNNNNNNYDEGDEDEEDEEDDQGNDNDEDIRHNIEEQSASIQSCAIKAEESLSQNNINNTITNNNNNTNTNGNQYMHSSIEISYSQPFNGNKNGNNQLISQQQQIQPQEQQQQCQQPQRTKPLLNKNVVQSKNALFQMVEIEAKIKSEQSIHSEQNIINQNNQIEGTQPVVSTMFQPVTQQIPIQQSSQQSVLHPTSQRDDQCNSANNSPSLNNLPKTQQSNQPWNRGGGGSKRMSFMESSVNLPSTPLLNCFSHLEIKQSQSLPTEITVKSYSKRQLKREEFEEELARSQLVLMDKVTKEMFVVTPQFIQQKITQDFQRNVAVLNSFMFANQVDSQQQQQQQQQQNTNAQANQTPFTTNSTSNASTTATANPSNPPNFSSINSAFTPATNNTLNTNPPANNNLPFNNSKNQATLTMFNNSLMNTPNISTTNPSNPVSFGSMQNGQGSTTSISMFLNTPPLAPSSITQLNSNNNHISHPGELTPGLFSYYGGQFNMSTQNLNQVNSPGMFFLQYSNANTPSQQLINQITPQHSAFSPQQQRIINQMPMATMLHANNLSNPATTASQSSSSQSSISTTAVAGVPVGQNILGKKNDYSVIQNAALLNKQLIHQDVSQLAKQ